MIGFILTAVILVIGGGAFLVLGSHSPLHALFHGRSSTTTESSGGSGESSPGKATVTVGGQLQDVTGPVVCSDVGMGKQIGVGSINIMLGPQENPLDVMMIQFPFTSYDGVTGLEYNPGDDGAHAAGSKDGNTYRFTGTLEGTKDHSSQGVSREFEIDATCP